MHDEVVKRRGWLTDQEFLDLLGATNLIPGPNSTEMAIHIGYLRAGWPGLILGGACFILPSMLIVMALAWVSVGQTPRQAGFSTGSSRW
jgi:chromate transporter